MNHQRRRPSPPLISVKDADACIHLRLFIKPPPSPAGAPPPGSPFYKALLAPLALLSPWCELGTAVFIYPVFLTACMFLGGKEPVSSVFITLNVLGTSGYRELGTEGTSADGSPKMN